MPMVKEIKVFFSLSKVTPVGPQENFLGLLLFVIFLNGMQQAINHSVFYLYGDDLKILSTKNLRNAQIDIDYLLLWAGKCKVVFVN